MRLGTGSSRHGLYRSWNIEESNTRSSKASANLCGSGPHGLVAPSCLAKRILSKRRSSRRRRPLIGPSPSRRCVLNRLSDPIEKPPSCSGGMRAYPVMFWHRAIVPAGQKQDSSRPHPMPGFRFRRRWPRFCTSRRVGLPVHEAVRCRRGVEPIHYSRHTKPCVVLQERRHEERCETYA
jgi:hypothetical protein